MKINFAYLQSYALLNQNKIGSFNPSVPVNTQKQKIIVSFSLSELLDYIFFKLKEILLSSSTYIKPCLYPYGFGPSLNLFLGCNSIFDKVLRMLSLRLCVADTWLSIFHMTSIFVTFMKPHLSLGEYDEC